MCLVLVSSKVRSLKVEDLKVLMDTIVGKYRRLYRVHMVDLLV